MYIVENLLQFLGLLRNLFSFVIEIFKSGYLIPIFLIYSIAVWLLLKLAFMLLLKLGYNVEREKKELKKNVLYALVFGCIVFMGILGFVYLFYWVCSVSNIPLTDNLIQINKSLTG